MKDFSIEWGSGVLVVLAGTCLLLLAEDVGELSGLAGVGPSSRGIW